MTTTTAYVKDASIGAIAFQQADLSDCDFTEDDWVNLAVELFDRLSPDDVHWLPHQSEIIGPVGGDDESFLYLAQSCINEAFEQLVNAD